MTIVGPDPRIANVCIIGIVAVLCAAVVGIYYYESNADYGPQYEVEMSDGTVYLCRDTWSEPSGKTLLYHVDGIKDNNVTVFTHLIVRCTPI